MAALPPSFSPCLPALRLWHLGIFLLLTVCARAETRYVEGEVIVTFKATATLDKAKAVLKKKSLAFTQYFDGLSTKRGKHTGLVRDARKTTAQLIADLLNDPDIETVEPNYLRWVNAVPNDTRFAELWGLQNTGQSVNGTAGTADADTKFVSARALARTPQSEIVVGVLDTGADYIHPDLAPNMWVNTSEIAGNNIDDDGNGYIDDLNGYDFAGSAASPADSGYHGTHVAGTIAALGDNQAGVIGVNDKARIIAMKVSSDGNTINSSAAIQALQYAVALRSRGVNLVTLNASYGGGGFSSAERAAIQAAGDAGIIMCVAAGNETANNDSTPTYPASYRLANMIVVAASNQNDALASYSNYGATTVDIAAPGSNILSAQPSTVSLRIGATTYASTALDFSGMTTGLTGHLIDCGIGNPADFPAAVQGHIALIQRGTLTFAAKVANAMAAGATAAIIYNNVSGTFLGTLGTAGNWIPARSISQADGLAIKAALPQTGSIVVTGNYQFLDGTSMATPHVTGAVAFAAMNFPGETVAQRRQRILAGIDVKSGLQGKVVTGGRLNLLRIVDANNNGFGDWQETTPVITTNTLPLAINGEAYSQTLAESGGVPPLTWSLLSGSLPASFTLSSAGVLSGTSSVTGTYPITVKVTDTLGATGTKALVLNTAATGPLHHFTWSYVPATAYAGTPFAVSFRACDAGERPITTAGGTVTLTSSSLLVPASVTLTNGAFLGYVTTTQASASATITATQGSISGTSGSIVVQSGASTAGDGIPDAWKTANGLSTAGNIAALDIDGDGMTNLQEYIAGTDPRSAASALKILSSSSDATGQISLSYPCIAGKYYRICKSSDLNAWTALDPNIFSASSGTQSATITLGVATKLFVRVEIVP